MGETTGRIRSALEGRYRIERELGHGGMATVYLAEDERHRRKVAVKVLRPDLASVLGPDRFLREIELAAQLTHPHILPLHDSGEADGFLYYVMPYIDGESLRDRLAKEGELPVTDAIRVIREVVDALAYAHGQGVVHRDIKPDNVMMQGRHAMVADFGVAKAVSEATGRQQITTAGVALGTPTYMAPEQAAADPHIDHRADIYAVGAMAYELLTGRPPFTGATPQQVLSAHVTQAPEPVTSRRASIPPALAHLVMKCLEKRPADRWQSADDMLPHLEGIVTPSGGMTPTGMTPVPAGRRPVNVAVLSGVVVAAAVLGFLGWTSFRRSQPLIVTSNIRQLTRDPALELFPAISPDGGQVVYTMGAGRDMHLYVRDLAGGGSLPLTAGRAGLQVSPEWTPDGASVVYWNSAPDDGGLRQIARLGGTVRTLSSTTAADALGVPEIRMRQDSLFVRMPGDTALAYLPDVSAVGHSIAWSRDRSRFAAVAGNQMFVNVETQLGNIAPSTIVVGLRVGGSPTVVAGGDGSLNMSPVWLPDGRHLLYVSNRDGPRDIYLATIDGSGSRRGEPVRVTTGLDPHTISISDDGSTLAYSRFTLRTNIWAVTVPRAGSVSLSDARAVTVGNQQVENSGISDDRRWLAYDSNLEGNQDVYLMPLDGGDVRQVTSDPGDDFHPDPSPDGREIVFYSTRFGNRDLFAIRADGNGLTRLTDDPRDERHPAFSPDGLSIAFEAFWPRAEVYVMSRPSPDGPWGAPRQVTQNGGRHPRWSPDGSGILYDNNGATVLGIIAPDGTGDRRVFDAGAAGLVRLAWPDWSRDGRALYFTGVDTAGVQALYTVPASGGRPRVLIHFDDPTKQVPYSFSVGDGVIYVSVTEYESDIWAMDVEVR